MSDTDNAETASPTPDTDANDASIFELPGDWFLRNLIQSIVGNGVEIGLTLSVKGVIVSGIAISGEKYIDLVCDQFTGGKPEGDVRHIIGESLRGWKAVYVKPSDAGDDWERPWTGYIHLKDAVYMAPGGQPIPANTMLWRGRLAEVDGFSLGNFEVK